ncbi:5-oxoprolinase subunit PxpA [Colwellia sp. RSH04]|uniref:5-oxoprolinase subunit PxpA n=1 Tax=Colwellia sp. RSH04 TaxID=2305464 RepID=UPI000E572DE5|nr:5-oxoprolinase subunit PxpA [Colwellia sp. RSH04]RHW76500.1 5-oxoprolinase subunit PxpA [Colwellia sp. RSH04]
MKLNCDLGESYGIWQLGQDNKLMPHIDMANIACGFHAGDPSVINSTLLLAKNNQTEVGAHPSYPDKVGFGRRSMKCSTSEIIDFMHYQIAALDGMAKNHGITISYVKPHGALYNDMMSSSNVADAIFESIHQYHRPLKLMLLATPDQSSYQDKAKQYRIDLIFEAFADRRYTSTGHLMSREHPKALLNKQEMLEQVENLISKKVVISQSGEPLVLKVDSLCVHGDNAEAINVIKQLKLLCSK